ncbi:MAG: VOC family protein [Pseudomonadota bacterium]
MSAGPELLRAMPVLQVADVKRSEAFYCQKLGFRSHGCWGEGPDFAIVQRGQVTIAFDRTRQPGHSATNQYWAAYLYVSDVTALCAAFAEKGITPIRGPEDTPYGLRDIDIKDPDGHIIAFGQDLEAGKAGPGLEPSNKSDKP